MTEIEKTEGEIKVLQAKLELLKEIETHKSPVKEAYKNVYGVYPHNTDDLVWGGFQEGYEAAKYDGEDISKVLIEGDDAYIMGVKYQRVEEATKPMDEVVERLVKKYQAQKLWNIVRDELGYSIDCVDEIVDTVEEWLPKEQSAAGTQNVDTELLVDGFNHCLQKIKGMLR